MSARRGRPGLIVIWGVLIVLIGAIAVLEGPGLLDPSPTEPADAAPLFHFAEADLGGIQVVYRRQIASLMRGAEGLWYQHDDSHSHGGAGGAAPASETDERHRPTPTQSAEIADRLAQITRLAANRVDSDGASLEAYGLARSETMIAFYGRGAEGVDFAKPMAVLYIGDLRPESKSYYARLDGAPDITLLPEAEINTLIQLVLARPTTPAADTQQ